MTFKCLYHAAPVALSALPALFLNDVSVARMLLKSSIEVFSKCEESLPENVQAGEEAKELVSEPNYTY